MIITCPHCQTKYQVTYEAIGAAGRKVQCAHCQQAWQQAAPMIPEPEPSSIEEDDKLYGEMAEDVLDEAFMAEAARVAPSPPPAPTRAEPVPRTGRTPMRSVDPAELKKRQQAFSRRQSAMFSRLPMARLRRTARLASVVMLVGLVALLYFGRTQLVERYPDLAGVYAAVGMGVNVVGLEFSNLDTLKTLTGGDEVLVVSAQIVGLMPKPVRVPPVVVSLLDARGKTVYEWSVASRVGDLMAGERATFETRLTLPPVNAVRVRLTFATANALPETREEPAPPQAPEASQHPAAPAATEHAAEAPAADISEPESAHGAAPAAEHH